MQSDTEKLNYIQYLIYEANRLIKIGQIGIGLEKFKEVLEYEPNNEVALKSINLINQYNAENRMEEHIIQIPENVLKALKAQWYNELKEKKTKEELAIPKVQLSERHIKNLKVLLDRHHLLQTLPKGAVCAEIGVDKGDFSEKILETTNPQKLHLIDAWGNPERYHDGLKYLVLNRFNEEINQGKVEVNVGYSTDVLKNFPDYYFDWVYLDTAHSYKVTKEELIVLKDKVKNDGIISGHDYIIGNWVGNVRYGVIEAVHEFCVKYNWELIYLTIQKQESPSFAIRRI